MVLLSSTTNSVAAEVDEAKLIKLKSAYLYNLLKFTHWPEENFSDDQEPIQVIILGNTPVADVFIKAVKDRTAQDRPIKTTRIDYPKFDNENNAPESEEQTKQLAETHAILRDAHMVFISDKYSDLWPSLRSEVADSQTLFVSDMDQFARSGGMVGLALNDKNRLSFEVNLDALEANGLRLSSSLLKLAEVIRDSKASVEHAPLYIKSLMTWADQACGILAQYIEGVES